MTGKQPTFTLVVKIERKKKSEETESDNFRRETTIISFDSVILKIAIGRLSIFNRDVCLRGVFRRISAKEIFFKFSRL